MKAVVVRSYGPPESHMIEDIPSVSPGEGEVKIQVKACGVNFPDRLVMEGKDQYKPQLPFSPGGECAGIVMEIGSGVKHLKVGDNVFAGTVWGSFREEVIARGSNTFRIPENMDFQTAAIFIAAFGTAMHTLRDRAQLKSRETVAVLGAGGGVGTAIIQVAKALGAKVIACASSQEKLDFCKMNGADLLVNYSEVDLKSELKALTNNKGVDVLCDPVGSQYSEPALRATAWRGRYMVIGFTAGSIAKIPLNLPLLKGNAIVGVFWSTFARRHPEENRKNILDLLELYQRGKISPKIHGTFPLKDFVKAMNEIKNRKVRGKIVLLP